MLYKFVCINLPAIYPLHNYNVGAEGSSLPMKKKVVRYSLAQKNHLQYMYNTGMTGCSRNHSVFIHKAANDTGLTVQQVKVWHMYSSFMYYDKIGSSIYSAGSRKKTL